MYTKKELRLMSGSGVICVYSVIMKKMEHKEISRLKALETYKNAHYTNYKATITSHFTIDLLNHTTHYICTEHGGHPISPVTSQFVCTGKASSEFLKFVRKY